MEVQFDFGVALNGATTLFTPVVVVFAYRPWPL